MELYETVRAQHLAGGAGQDGRTALRFHGMRQGLMLLLRRTIMPAPRAVALPGRSPRLDGELIRLIANFVLYTHSELTHVC